MKYVICHLSAVPCRISPSDSAEMVTELLFGETAELLEKQNQWLHIKTTYDNYECWIDEKQVLPLSVKDFENYQKQTTMVSELVNIAIFNDNIFPLTLGAVLPQYGKQQFTLNKRIYTYEGQTITPKKNDIQRITEIAFLYLNAPYLWGGRSPFGIDCSGFTQMVYKLCGIKIPRDASQQVAYGMPLNFIDEAMPGDLAFFDNAEGKITHVGIVLENNKIIHASGKVRIDRLDHFGIFNADSNKYTHRLRVIKSFR